MREKEVKLSRRKPKPGRTEEAEAIDKAKKRQYKWYEYNMSSLVIFPFVF